MGVKIRERFPGQWWVFVTHKGNRTAKPAGDYETALEAKKIIENQLALGMFQFPKREPKKPKEPPAITVKEYYETFKRTWIDSACRESTRERYKGTFDLYVLPRFGEKAIKAVTRAEIKDFVAELVAKKLARATIRIIVSNFCTMFSHAIEDEIIQANPATRMPKYFKQAHIVHEEIQPLTPDEVPTFLEATREHDQKKRYKDVPEYYSLFLCAIHTGMRSGELSGLQWSDIDWNGKFIIVRRTLKAGKTQPTKTGKIRRIDMSDALIDELRAMRKRRRFHDLRHTFASLLIGNGEPLAYVKDQLGHSSIKVTVDVYGHLVPGANRQAVNRLPSLTNNTLEKAQAL